MKSTKLILAFLFISFCFSECKKYPEDNCVLHLKTIKGRLAGGRFGGSKGWVRAGYSYLGLAFYTNGDFKGYSAPLDGITGTWELVDKNDKLRITDRNGAILECTILRLDNNSLSLQKDSTIFGFNRQK